MDDQQPYFWGSRVTAPWTYKTYIHFRIILLDDVRHTYCSFPLQCPHENPVPMDTFANL